MTMVEVADEAGGRGTLAVGKEGDLTMLRIRTFLNFAVLVLC